MRRDSGDLTMRTAHFLAGVVFLCAAVSAANAADMAVRQKHAAVPEKVAPAEAVCIKWVEQNYSWYNYCDPIPYYGRNKYAWQGGLF